MTQALYAHMNNKIKKRKYQQPENTNNTNIHLTIEDKPIMKYSKSKYYAGIRQNQLNLQPLCGFISQNL
jgi:hypothetical protein